MDKVYILNLHINQLSLDECDCLKEINKVISISEEISFPAFEKLILKLIELGIYIKT